LNQGGEADEWKKREKPTKSLEQCKVLKKNKPFSEKGKVRKTSQSPWIGKKKIPNIFKVYGGGGSARRGKRKKEQYFVPQ